MRLSRTVKPVSYVKSHAAELIREVNTTGEPLIITQNGEAKAVLMDLQTFEQHRESLAMLKILALSGREFAQGDYEDADSVLAQMRNHYDAA